MNRVIYFLVILLLLGFIPDKIGPFTRIQYAGLASTTCSCTMFLPQLYKYYKTKNVGTLDGGFLFLRSWTIIFNGIYLTGFFDLETENVLPMYISYIFTCLTTITLWCMLYNYEQSACDIVHHHHYAPAAQF
jgi:uncharacterized protein with PQ loop repeat